MTFSIIAIDRKNKELGSACFSKAFAVGGIVPEVKLKVGAVCTQSYPNVTYKEEGIELMKKYPPKKVINLLTKSDSSALSVTFCMPTFLGLPRSWSWI